MYTYIYGTISLSLTSWCSGGLHQPSDPGHRLHLASPQTDPGGGQHQKVCLIIPENTCFSLAGRCLPQTWLQSLLIVLYINLCIAMAMIGRLGWDEAPVLFDSSFMFRQTDTLFCVLCLTNNEDCVPSGFVQSSTPWSGLDQRSSPLDSWLL